MSAQRTLDPTLVWRVGKNTLGRMACEYGDPTRDGHDHQVCLRDDESYAAHLMLKLINAVARDHDDDVLDVLGELQACVHPAT